jgi:hypothetical protein
MPNQGLENDTQHNYHFQEYSVEGCIYHHVPQNYCYLQYQQNLQTCDFRPLHSHMITEIR